MALYVTGSPVSVVLDGEQTALTRETVVADVIRAAGGDGAIRGMPPGGAPGALLRKASGADGDVAWVVGSGAAALGFAIESAGGGIPRPAGHGSVLWLGQSNPLNGAPGDVWIQP